jgi:hypothetical protein
VVLDLFHPIPRRYARELHEERDRLENLYR